MVSLQARDAFWSVVEDCLVEFHHYSRAAARKRSKALRGRIELPPPGVSSEIFYHAEPFDVACDIAENPIGLEQHRDQYEVILSHRNW